MIVEAEAKLFEDYKNIAVFNPADVLCDAKSCLQTLNGEALYYDGRHLTVKGSLLMVDGIMKALQPLLENNQLSIALMTRIDSAKRAICCVDDGYGEASSCASSCAYACDGA